MWEGQRWEISDTQMMQVMIWFEEICDLKQDYGRKMNGFKINMMIVPRKDRKNAKSVS